MLASYFVQQSVTVRGNVQTKGTQQWGFFPKPNYSWARGDTYVSQRTNSPVPSDSHFPTPTSWGCGASVGTFGTPVMANANAYYCDPQYNGAVIVRMTDGITASRTLLGLTPNHNPSASTVTCTPAASCPPSMNTAQGGSDQQYFINANDTLMTINTEGGVSSVLPISLNAGSNPPTLQVLPVGGFVGETLVGWAGGSNTWDHHDPNKQYYVANGTALGGCPADQSAICQMLFARAGGLYNTAPFITQLIEPAQAGCLGTSFTATWNTEFQVSDDGTKFAVGYSNSSKMSGSVTSGTFTLGEIVKQASTNAQAVLLSVLASGPMEIGSISGGTPDASDNWVGQTSGAIYAPTQKPQGEGQGSIGAHYLGLYDKTSNSCAVLDLNGPNCTIFNCPYIPSPSITGGTGWPYYTGPLLGDLANMACNLHNVNTTPNNGGYAHISCNNPGSWTWQIQAAGVAGSFKNTWAVGTTYNQGDEIWYNAGSGLQWYISLVGSNVGHTPSSSPSQWQPGTWVPSTSYSVNAVVFDGTAAAVSGNCSTAYVALNVISSTTNPCADPTNWSTLPSVNEGSWWVSPYAPSHLIYSFQGGTMNGPLQSNKEGGHNSQGFTHIWNSTGAQYSAVRNYIPPNYETAGIVPVTAASVPVSQNTLEALCAIHCTGAAYSGGTTYSQYDIVTSGGNRFISSQSSNTGNAPTTAANAWWIFEQEFSGHTSASAMDSSDQNMVTESTTNSPYGDTFPSYGYAEILGLQCATNDTGSNPVTTTCSQSGWYRFAPTWTEATDTNFNNQQAIGGEDPTGQLFCWSTSELDTLGTDHSSQPRGDVFCVILGAHSH